MVTVKHIMVTTDLSPASHAAMEYAAWLAQKEKAGVVVFYSVDNLPTVAYHTVDLTFDKFRDEILDFEKKRLKEFTESYAETFPGKLRSVITEGNAAQEIVRFAHEQKIDVIVMSTHGRTGFQHVLLGSVTERVVRTAPCPVLTVKSDETDTKAKVDKKAKKRARR